jgi:hypothetical protein
MRPGGACVQTPDEILQSMHVCVVADALNDLSQFSKFAAEIFEDLFVQTNAMLQRTANLSKRVSTIDARVAGTSEVVRKSLASNRSALVADRSDWTLTCPEPPSQLLTPKTRPTVLQRVYTSIAAVPSLHELDCFRDDGQPCMKLFSYPQFFLDEWVRSNASADNREKKRRKKKPTRVATEQRPRKVREMTVRRYDNQGNVVASTMPGPPTPSATVPPAGAPPTAVGTALPPTSALGAPPPPPPGSAAAMLGAPPPPPGVFRATERVAERQSGRDTESLTNPATHTARHRCTQTNRRADTQTF